MEIPQRVTREFLYAHPDCIFVFGDNTVHRGRAGAASLRGEPNTYGFVTKRYPSSEDCDFFTPNEYRCIYTEEMIKLKDKIRSNPDKIFLISQLGSGLANRYRIWERVIEPSIRKDLAEFGSRIVFLF